MDRRNFIKKSAISTAVIATPFYIPKKERPLRVGLIGVGWYGMVLMKAAFKGGANIEVIGIADVDTQHLADGATELETLQGKKPKTFTAYQDVLDMNGLDAVFIATPPHWHALQLIAACEKGLPVYCEKPLSYDVREGQAMVDAVKKAGNIVQVGFQRRQSRAFQTVAEHIREGKLGNVRQIEAQIHYGAKLKDTSIQEPPESLDWDQWCGPAPKLPYRPSIGHISWRLEKEYGHGHLVDWGIHHIDIIRKIMDLDLPTSLNSFGGIYKFKDKITTPDTLTAQIDYADVPVVWNHRLWGPAEYSPEIRNGVLFYGDEATVFASDHKMVLIPNEEDAERQETEMRTPDMQEKHVIEFINAVQQQNPDLISCDIEEGFKSAASVQLAMTSYESGDQVKFDPQKMDVTNSKVAQSLLKRDYRGQWEHPWA